MQLVIHFKDGAPLLIPVSVSHTVQVIGPVGGVQDAFSFDGVTDVSFVVNENAPPIVSEDSGVITVGGNPVNYASVQSITTTQTATGGPAGPPSADESQDAIDHAQAVDDISSTVAASTDAITADAQHDALVKANQDLAVALAQWPDSAELLDLQAELDKLTV